ncbi:MAG: hypothetical protein ABSB19_06815 [Methylomonas sp.]
MSNKKSKSKIPGAAETAVTTPPSDATPETGLTAKTETCAEAQQTACVSVEESATGKKRKASKAKVIRDSFSFPENDYRIISQLKKTCLAAGTHVKKGEILRAGLLLLSKLELSELTKVIEQVEKVKTGRPNIAKG